MAEQMDIDAPPANGKEAASDRTETLANSGSAAVRSIEGWILIASNLHEEASEEDLQDFFAEFGDIKTITMSMDKRTGYTKGYALIEYTTHEEAKRAVEEANGGKFVEQTIHVDFAFVRPPPRSELDARGTRGGRRGGGGRNRSRSPGDI